jgi:protein-disulfide isomerase
MRLVAMAAFLCLMAALAQTPAPKSAAPDTDWQKVTKLNNVDFTGLSTVQKTAALKELRARPCLCGCGMKLAECRVKDPNCSDSTGLAQIVIGAIRAGRDIDYAIEHSDLVARRTGAPNILEKPVAIPIDGAPSKGPANARLVLVEFSDFECPYCSQAALKVDAILKAFPNDIRLVYKQFPIATHPHANLAAAASLAAHAQNKFWPMHDQLFANGRKLSAEKINELAKSLGLDMNRFQADLKSPKIKAAVDKDLNDGNKITISGTPTFFLNGKRYNGSLEMSILKPILESELKAGK